MKYIMCDKCKNVYLVEDLMKYPDTTPCCDAEWSTDQFETLGLDQDVRSIHSDIDDEVSNMEDILSSYDNDIYDNIWHEDSPKETLNNIDCLIDMLDDHIDNAENIKERLCELRDNYEEGIGNMDEFDD